jgi:hypothetical protein
MSNEACLSTGLVCSQLNRDAYSVENRACACQLQGRFGIVVKTRTKAEAA